MSRVKAYAAMQAKELLKPYEIERRTPASEDVLIDIHYCGVCHSDLHQARAEWGAGLFPMVPGHEIVGVVRQIGSGVTRFQVGDRVGVGCMVDSCRQCDPCARGMEQFCEQGMSATYNSCERDGKTPTYGGYSKQIVVDQRFVLKIPAHLPLDQAAPLLCAGITTYSPLKHWQIKAGSRVGVIGLGGLGHMAIKIAAAMGAEVTLFTTSESKKEDAYRFGAKNVVNTKNAGALTPYLKAFDFILNTASGVVALDAYLELLKLDGTLTLVGVPEHPATLSAFPLIMQRRRLAGSLIGGTWETQEMLDFCGEHRITADIELIQMDQINEAYERMLKGDVRYRFVIDLSSL